MKMKFLKQTFHILYGYLNVDEKHSIFPPGQNHHPSCRMA